MAATWLWYGEDKDLVRVGSMAAVSMKGRMGRADDHITGRTESGVDCAYGREGDGVDRTNGREGNAMDRTNGIKGSAASPASICPSVTTAQAGDVIIVAAAQKAISMEKFNGIWVINAGAAVSMDSEGSARLWRRNGLSVDDGLQVSKRIYRVTVINLAPYRICRIDGKEGAWSGIAQGSRSHRERHTLEPQAASAAEGGTGYWPQDAPMRRVARAAVRALYVLGLDIGEAEITLSDGGRVAVRSARPLAPDTEQGAEALERFAAWYAAAGAITEDRRRILIGADPEFALLTPEGKLAPASRFFGAGSSGAAGADALLVGRRLLYPVAELRPAPAESPAALAANVRRLLARAARKVGDPALRWVAGAMPLPGLALGGHIHISGAPLTGRLLRLLDSCAAYPLALVEDPAGRGRRPRYGALGDFRPQPHGGFEYRTLPSWLVSPAAAKAAFALALLCAREALRMPRIPAQEERYAAAYYAGDRAELAGCLDAVASAVAATESYAALAPCIEPLFDAARRGKTWDESADIRTKWRLPL